MAKEKLKLKKGDFVQVHYHRAAQIKRINKKSGYTLRILPSPECESCYYSDKELVRINKRNLDRYTTEEFLKSIKKPVKRS